VNVFGYFRGVPVDDAREFADARGLVFDDGFEQFEIRRPEDAGKRCEISNNRDADVPVVLSLPTGIDSRPVGSEDTSPRIHNDAQ